MRSKYWYVLITVLVVAVSTGVFFYRTDTPLPVSNVQTPTIAQFGGVSLRIEYATSTKAREQGLGGRTSIPSDYGMLFLFKTDDRYGFWMKDTLVPLDIFWLNDKGQVVYVAAHVATSSYPAVFYPPVSARYVLETVAGFARSHSIRLGSTMSLQNLPSVTE